MCVCVCGRGGGKIIGDALSDVKTCNVSCYIMYGNPTATRKTLPAEEGGGKTLHNVLYMNQFNKTKGKCHAGLWQGNLE